MASTTQSPAPQTLSCDVLVLGAGLAGLRAAWAARETDPRLRVIIATPTARPSGSSFANRNNALGMQAPGCFPGDTPEDFVDEVLALAAPGLALRPLAQALAQDAPERLRDLLALALNLRRESGGAPQRFPGCFSASPRAVIYDGLAHAHRAFLGRAQALGAEMLPGMEAVELLRGTGREPRRVGGAMLRHLRTGRMLAVRAATTIAALGGPAPLFARRTCGPGGTGLSYGLLAQAGARLVNTPYLQFFWVLPQGLEFLNPGELAWPGLPPELAAARLGHCPAAYGLPDALLDRRLAQGLDAASLVRVEHPRRGALTLTLAAHAGNGGALIDAHGRTTAPGLFACGECASGMHGANRLGGAMVLAALVFGARAGSAAAREARNVPTPQPAPQAEPTGIPPATSPAPPGSAGQPGFLAWLRRAMQRHALLAGRHAPTAERLRELAREPGTPQRQRLLALSALAVLGQVDGAAGADEGDAPDDCDASGGGDVGARSAAHVGEAQG